MIRLTLSSILTSLLLLNCGSPTGNLYSSSSNKKDSIVKEKYILDITALKLKADEALKFIKSKSMNEDFCVLIDMSIHSGRNRFFVWDFKKDTITNNFLVSHGCCGSRWGRDYTKENPTFSNVENSHCTSLGKYKIGERGVSTWGGKTKYLLHGLEKSNSKALKRAIVFHSWEAVLDNEIYPIGTPEGWGCPAISNDNFLIIDYKLKNTKRPVLMWLYND